MLTQSCLTLCDLWTVARQGPLSMGFPRQEYWSGLPFPTLGDLSDAGIELASPAPTRQPASRGGPSRGQIARPEVLCSATAGVGT